MKQSGLAVLAGAIILAVGVYYSNRPVPPAPPVATHQPEHLTPDAPAPGPPTPEDPHDPFVVESTSRPLTICSFNIQFLGHFKKRDDEALASLLRDFDIVVVQELVAPPFDGAYPDGEPFHMDGEAREFFDAMEAHGFACLLSKEDTGTNDTIHTGGTGTEWWVAFFKPGVVEEAPDLPSGFLAEDRSNHPDYERVPWAFAFRTVDTLLDFVLISVHLKPGASEQARRHQELSAIATWIDDHDDVERDFIILGDMNIEDAEELAEVTPAGFVSLNNECRPVFDMQVIDLIEVMRDSWVSQIRTRAIRMSTTRSSSTTRPIIRWCFGWWGRAWTMTEERSPLQARRRKGGHCLGRPMAETEVLLVGSTRWWGNEGLRASAGRLCQKPLASTSSRHFEFETAISDQWVRSYG